MKPTHLSLHLKEWSIIMDPVRFASKNNETTDISSNQHERGQTHNTTPDTLNTLERKYARTL